MSARVQLFGVAAIALASLIAPAELAGQSDPGAIQVRGLISGSLAAGHAAPTVGVSGSYRLAPRLAVEGDVSHFSDLTLAEFMGAPSSALTSFHARLTSAMANAVIGLPDPVRWLRPYLSAGGGVARIRREVRGADVAVGLAPRLVEPKVDIEPVVSVGGGVDFLLSRKVAVGIDLRYQRVFEDERLFRPNLRNLKRIGSSVSYRF
jgi:Outer membrane protein beta-barrel domain